MPKSRAIIVVGVNRGGTSAVAASLNSLGIFLGESWHEPVYEDLALAHAFRGNDWKRFSKIVSKYEGEHETFAWKLPDVTKHLEKVHKHFRSPRYIFVFRDLSSIADRMNSALDTSHIDGMIKANRSYARVLRFISKKRPEHILVSYEKMLTQTRQYATTLLSFLDYENNQQHIDSITSVITPSPERYRQWSANSKQSTQLKKGGYQGHLDHVNSHEVAGWAKSISSDSPVSVDIFLNEKKLAQVEANIFREDLIAAKVANFGNHGFCFQFETPISPLDTITVKTTNGIDLVGSPQQGGQP